MSPKIQFIPPHTSSPCSLPCLGSLRPQTQCGTSWPSSPLPLLPGHTVWTVFPRLPGVSVQRRQSSRNYSRSDLRISNIHSTGFIFVFIGLSMIFYIMTCLIFQEGSNTKLFSNNNCINSFSLSFQGWCWPVFYFQRLSCLVWSPLPVAGISWCFSDEYLPCLLLSWLPLSLSCSVSWEADLQGQYHWASKYSGFFWPGLANGNH